MKNIFAVTLSALLLLFAACSQKVNNPADVQAIKDISPAFDTAVKAGDADKLVALFTDDALRMGPNQPALAGKDAIRAAFQKYYGQFSEEVRDVTEDVRVSGDLAVVRGTYEVKSKLKAGGFSAQVKGNWICAAQRQADGSWKVFWNMYAPEVPVADTLSPGADEQALMKIEQDWAAATAKNDTAAMDKILAAEYANNTDGLITSKKQALANMKSGASKVASATAGEMRVLIFGETAVVHGLWEEKSTLNGKDTSGTYRYTDVFAKRAGQWLAVSTSSTKVK